VKYRTASGEEGLIWLDSINGVIYVRGGQDAYVKGKVSGQATVASESDVWINKDVLYKSDPRTIPESTDFLGIVAQQDIIVKNNKANRSNCEIHAALLAIDGSFTVQDFDEGSPRGELEVLGGIVQSVRGPVGTFDQYGPRSGYRKNYVYDERLLTIAPPSFPLMDRPILVAWVE
jgi:hypothetical protein